MSSTKTKRVNELNRCIEINEQRAKAFEAAGCKNCLAALACLGTADRQREEIKSIEGAN